MDLRKRSGTDYYLNLGERENPELVHICKLAFGIRFVVRANPEHYSDYRGFAAFVTKGCIYNEFGSPVSSDFLLRAIQSKSRDPSVKPDFKKAGKAGIVRMMQQFDSDGNVVAEYDCVAENFGKDMTGVYLKKDVFDRPPMKP